MITIDEDIRFACHIAAMQAIDDVLDGALGARFHTTESGRRYQQAWIQDRHLPDLLPALDRAIDAALRDARLPLPAACKP